MVIESKKVLIKHTLINCIFKVLKQQLNDARTNGCTEIISEVDGRQIKEHEDKFKTDFKQLKHQSEKDVTWNEQENVEFNDRKVYYLFSLN